MAIYYFLYSAITGAGMLLLSPYFLYKGLRERKYLQNLPERMAWKFPTELLSQNGASAGTIWLHAVSVGEVLAALPLARSLKERFPARRLVVSTTTATGQTLARERMRADAVFYFPLDWRGPMSRALGQVRPTLAIICETEIWPNFLREARRAGVPVLFVNGRISDRSFARLSRTANFGGGLLRGFMRRVLADATAFLTQSEQDAARLVALGAAPERVLVAGNIKYDMAPAPTNSLVAWLSAELERSHRGPLLVAGSVIAGEEQAVLEGFAAVRKKWPKALLTLAPRKPERFDAATAIAEQAGHRVLRRSALAMDGSASGALECAGGRDVLLLDTIGELAALYGIADAVFVGGSLVPAAGGHNPLEPAAAGKTPIFGPAMENFREIASTLLTANAAIEVHNGEELGAAWTQALSDPDRSAAMGAAARNVVERQRGATRAILEYAAKFLEESPHTP